MATFQKQHTRDQLACAHRTFEKACHAKEAFACGMIGRLMLEDPATPDQTKEGRRYLEAACDELDGSPAEDWRSASNLENLAITTINSFALY